jgi:hypothetical protein
MMDFLNKLFDEEPTAQAPTLKTQRTTMNFRQIFSMPLTIANHFADFLFRFDYFSTTKLKSEISLT